MIDWLACCLVRAIGALLCALPTSVAVGLGEWVGILASWCSSKRARIGLRNLRAAFDGRMSERNGRRILRACYQQLGASAIELLRLPVIDRAYLDRYVTFDGRHHFEAAVATGRPIVLLTGHYGNWELSSIVAALNGYPIVALARAQSQFPRLYRLLVSYRESKGCTIVHKGGAMKRLIAALEARQLIGIVGDQASRQGIWVDFFGRPALFATGPFELAYAKDALIVPAFIHRLRGPFHRLVVEPPFSLERHGSKDAAIRAGIERFATLLSRHIQETLSQWLWMHKRWKHTPARRALVLSDGKVGHLKQSLAVVEAARERCPSLTHAVIDIRYRSPLHRMAALLWSWWLPGGFGAARCLRWTLTPESANRLLTRYADLLISCGASTAPANLLWAGANGAKSIVLMNPTPLPLSRFSLVIAPRHDRLPSRRNVLQTTGALSHGSDDAWERARTQLHAHPNFRAEVARTPVHSTPALEAPFDKMVHTHPVIGVFLGGETAHYEVNESFAETLIAQVLAACDALDGWCLVTTSRRTAPNVEQYVAKRLKDAPRCRLLLIASRDPMNGTMEGMLGSADVAVVTGESISMVSEACASGRAVVVVEPPLRRSHRTTRTKHQRFLQDLVREGYAQSSTLSELSQTLQHAITTSRRPQRLENFTKVRDAVGRLL